MTPDELTALIMAGDAQRLLDAVSNVAASERTALAKVAVLFTKQPPEMASSKTGDRWKSNHAECCAHLAVFGLGSWEQVKRLPRDQTHLWSNDINLYDWVFDFLKARRPDWIERWVSHQLADESNPCWRVVRKLVREGICPRPADDNYIIKMINGFWKERLADKKWQLVDSLRTDSGLLEDEIWKIFEVEPPGKGVLLFTNDLEDHPTSWSKALKTLSMSGEIDRGRLLTESLEALRRGRRAAGATWFFRFHELLEPTLDERSERQSLYLDLLGVAVPAVVAFAQDALGLLGKEKRIDARAYLDAVPRVFEGATKGPGVTAIKLIKQLVKQQPSLASSAAVVVCRAVSHESPDVQLAGITWLESLKLGPNDAVADELDHRMTSVAASLRERVQQLRERVQPNGTVSGTVANGAVAEGGVAETEVKTASPRKSKSSKPSADTPAPASQSSVPSAAKPESTPEEIALLSEIAALTNAQRVALGIDTGLRALDVGGELVAVEVDPLKMIHLLPERELKPIASFDELLDALLSAVETPCDADQFERLMDGLSRLCDQRPPDFAARTAPLLHRVTRLLDVEFKDRQLHELGLRGLSFYLAAAWCRPGSPLRIETASVVQRTGFEFLVDRVRELVDRITAGRAKPLLAAPTHKGGWLSAITFVNRLLECQRTGFEPDPLDLLQALLRLAPDDRTAASLPALELQSPFGDVVRFALGGPHDEVARGAAAHPALWVAAIRGRDQSLSIAGDQSGLDGPDAAPDVWVPASRQWHAVRRPDSLPPKTAWPLKLRITTNPRFGSIEFRRELPTLKLNYERSLDDEWVDGEMQRLRQRWPNASLSFIEREMQFNCMAWGPGAAAAVLRIWPIHPDPAFVTGIVSILRTLDAPASTLRRTTEFLEPLLSPQTRFSEMAQLLVAVSLLAKDPGLSAYAVDAAIALIEDGRCVGDELGGVFRKLLISDAVKCNRLAAKLGEVARISLLHAHVCARLVQTMFNDAASLPNGLLPNDAHHLLAPLQEWLVELNEPLQETTRSVLAQVTGASKTAKLAKALIARTSPVDKALRRQVVLASLRGRLRSARFCQP